MSNSPKLSAKAIIRAADAERQPQRLRAVPMR
jgi:hypothetical protein